MISTIPFRVEIENSEGILLSSLSQNDIETKRFTLKIEGINTLCKNIGFNDVNQELIYTDGNTTTSIGTVLRLLISSFNNDNIDIMCMGDNIILNLSNVNISL